MRRLVILALVLAWGTAGRAAAQTEVAFSGQEMIPGPWKFDNFPYFTVTPNEGFMLIGRAQYGRAADYLDRISMDSRFALEGGASPGGSRFAALMVDLPRIARGWRLAADFRLERNNRFGAFARDPGGDLALSPGDDHVRARRTRSSARVEVTRRLVGPLAIAASGSLSATDWLRLPPETGTMPAPLREENDAVGRVGLVLDLRDREFEPQKGALIEGGVYAGSFGEGYTGGYALASGFVTPRFGTVLAARIGGRSVGPDASLDARYQVPAWERPLLVLGGPQSNRGLPPGRLAGRGVLFASLEVRQVVVDGGDFAGVYLLGFVDAGRTFEDEEFRITADALEVSGGLGVALRILRANIFNLTAAKGPDGMQWMVGSGWAF